MEKTVYFKGRAYHLNQVYDGQPSYIHYVPFSNAEECCKKTRKITKRLSLGRGQLGKEGPFN